MITRTAGPARRASAMRMAAVMLIAGVVALGPAVPALADDPVIDPGQLASLTIHKYENPGPLSGLIAGDGAEALPGPALDPVPGVTYRIRQVGPIDVTAAGGWAQAFMLAGKFDPARPEQSIIVDAGFWLGAGTVQTTNANGVAEFDGLDLGVYLVEEIAVPPDVPKAAPFVVVLPVTNPSAPTQWLYDVHVYPKNAVVDRPLGGTIFATKRAADHNPHFVGETMDWIIDGEILDGGDVLWWRIIDHLDPRLRYVSVKAKFIPSGDPLVEGVDYEIIPSAGNTVTFEVLGPIGPSGPAGLANVTEHAVANIYEQIEVTITTELLDASTIPNSALVSTSIWDDPVGVTAKVDAPTDTADVVVVPAEAVPWLAWTGFQGLPYAFLGAGLVVGGFLLILVRRRRRDRSEATA